MGPSSMQLHGVATRGGGTRTPRFLGGEPRPGHGSACVSWLPIGASLTWAPKVPVHALAAPLMISNWRNLVVRKDLLRELAVTELRTSTAQTKLGWLWWLVDPFLMMLIYWVIVVELFGRGKDMYAPYWLYIFFGLVTWKHLAGATTRSAHLFASKKGLIRSVAFPTMVLPLASTIAGFVLFLFGFVTLGVMAVVADLRDHSGALLPLLQVIPLALLQLLVVAAVAVPISCLGVVYRDFGGLIPHLLRLGFYLSPGLYGVDLVESGLSRKFGESTGEVLFGAYMLNPFAIIISGYRDAIFYGRFMEPHYWAVLIVETVLLLALGNRIFQHYDRRVIKFL